MARLPTPGGDDGAWGNVLNDFLAQSHNSDGTLKAIPINKLVPGSDAQVLTSSGGVVSWSGVPAPTGLVATDSLVFNVKDHGAVGNGSTDDTAAIAATISAANTAGGGIVYFPTGTYISGQQTLYSNMTLQGAGTGASVLKLKNGSNTDLVVTDQFSSLTGGSANGPSKFSIRDITLDANRTNQTATSFCVRIYGYNYTIDNAWFINGYGGGVYSEWGGNDNPMETIISNFKIWNYGGTPGAKGLHWKGPHDSIISHGIIATLDSTIRPTDAAYGSTPINSSTATLPSAGTPFTFATTAAASTSVYPTSGGSFVVPIASGVYTWMTISYTGASTAGSVTTFTGCTATVGAINVTASGGIVVPTYGFLDNGAVGGDNTDSVHIWGRNHFGYYTTLQSYFSQCVGEGSFIANVVLDTQGCVWTGGTIYGSNGQAGQTNEVGLQIGQNNNATRNIVVTSIYNVGNGSGGAPIKMTRTAGNNMIRAAGSTSANIYLSSPFLNANGDWYECVCHNNSALTVWHVPFQPKLPFGIFLGNGANLASPGGHIYSGSGAPNISASAAGDYYFRTDTPGSANQRIYVATAANTWTGIV